MAARAFLFDIDGTIWDSFPWYASVLSQQGALEYNQALDMLTHGKSVARLLRSNEITPTRFKITCSNGMNHAVTYPGVHPTLRKLKGLGIPMSIVTSLPIWMVDPILGLLGISEYFRGVVGYGDTSMHKPHPAPLLKALKYLGLSASKDIWYVGDTEGDLNAARAVGLSFASALYGRGFPFEKANASLTKFSGILDL